MNKQIWILASVVLLSACTPAAQNVESSSTTSVAPSVAQSSFRWQPNSRQPWSKASPGYDGTSVTSGDAAFLASLEAGALKGDPFAQWHLAIAYDHDAKEVPKEEIQKLFNDAFKGFEELSKDGDTEATYQLASFYDEWNRYSEVTSPVAEDKNKTFQLYLAAAQDGFAPAQNSLGWAYILGEGVEKNEATGMEWMKKAALQGDASYQEGVGASLCTALGCDDPTEAVRWYEMAAKQGHRQAQRRLAKMHDDEGRVLLYDQAKALKWYKECGMLGDDECAWRTAYAYQHGEGTPPNNFNAYVWWAIAKAMGSAAATDQDLENVSEYMTPAQISDAQIRADQLFQTIQKNKESYPYLF